MTLLLIDSTTKETLCVIQTASTERSEYEVNQLFNAISDWISLRKNEAYHTLGAFSVDEAANTITQEIIRIKYGPAERADMAQSNTP